MSDRPGLDQPEPDAPPPIVEPPTVAVPPASPAAARLRELGDYIRENRRRAQYSVRHLAKLAGVSNPYLSQIERGLRKPSAQILQAIAKALNISSETLYIKAGILEERGDVSDLEAAILRDTSINERQRTALLEIYRSFHRENEAAAGLVDSMPGGVSGDGGTTDVDGAPASTP